MNYLAKKIAHLLIEYAKDSFYEDEIRYGLEIALGALLQIVIIVLAALGLGIGREVLALITAAGLYRRYSDGPHCQAYYRCTITSLISFIPLGLIAGYIPLHYLPAYIICLALISSVIIHNYVRFDPSIYDKSIQIKRRSKSYGVVALVLLASTISAYGLEQKLVAISLLLGLLWQNFTLLPMGHAYIHLWDLLFAKIEGLFRVKEVMKC